MISIKAKYAVSALFELALSEEGKPIQSRIIAERREIPHSFLEGVLVDLRQAGLLVSTRGAHGGHQLAKRPDDITLRDIVRAIDGEMRLSEGFCGDDVLKDAWVKIEAQVNQCFEITLKALINDKQRKEKMLTFVI